MKKTFDIDHRVGGLRLRAWGLMLNLLLNFVALFGLARLLRTGDGLILVFVGVVGTLVCIAAVARPAP